MKTLKRIISLILGGVVILAAFCACDNAEAADVSLAKTSIASVTAEITTALTTVPETTALSLFSTTPTEKTTTKPETTVLTTLSPEEQAKWDFDHRTFPVIDGSTSTIALDRGIRMAILGEDYYTANKAVSHSKTYEAYNKLMDGESDLILTTPITDNQRTAALTDRFNLAEKPVALEGFVFLVNPENPVDSLTSEQIRRIYSGNITNWKEVGGLDEPIIPYQRNADSGSQNYMNTFMGGVKLMEAPIEWYAGAMNILINEVADYPNSKQAIGYSVFSYAAQIAANDGNIKLIAVDGVKPTRETFTDGSYPLLSATYAYYNADNKLAADIAEWLVSDEGQMCVLDSGYLPVADLAIPDEYHAYTATGTGEIKPANLKPSKQAAEIPRFYWDDRDKQEGLTDDGLLDGILADKDYENEINEWIKEAIVFAKDKGESRPNISYVIRNGFMEISVGFEWGEVDFFYPEYASAAVFDLKSGKQLTKLSELFYKDSEFVPALNNVVSYGFTSGRVDKKTDFVGILGEPQMFTLTGMCLPGDIYVYKRDSQYSNIMFGFVTKYNETLRDFMPSWQFYDFSELLTENFRDKIEIYDTPLYLKENVIKNDSIREQYISSSRFLDKGYIDEINETLSVLYTELIYSEYLSDMVSNDFYEDYTTMEFVVDPEANLLRIECNGTFIYDLEKKRYIPLREMLTDEFFNTLSIEQQETILLTTAPYSKNGYQLSFGAILFLYGETPAIDFWLELGDGVGPTWLSSIDIDEGGLLPKYKKIRIYEPYD
jgi:phosphate transport system substrate-binding protein